MVSEFNEEKFNLDKNWDIKEKDIRNIPLPIYNAFDVRKTKIKDVGGLPSLSWTDLFIILIKHIDENLDSYKKTIEKLKKKKNSNKEKYNTF